MSKTFDQEAELKFVRLHPNALLPMRSHANDAGLDLRAVEVVHEGSKVTYSTGLAVQIPRGCAGLLLARSSIHKTPLRLCNSVGLIDSGYTGEIKAVFDVLPNVSGSIYNVGDRIMQLVVLPISMLKPMFVNELPSTDRGDGGFGSTGK